MPIDIIKCSKKYENESIGLNELTLSLPDHGVVFLKGNSGSGKTTFINCLSGLDHFSVGRIIYNGENVETLEKWSSFLFQENFFIEYLTVYENLKCVSKERDDIIDKLLSEMNISHLKNKIIANVSGGERFRISFIRSIIQKKNIIFLDEPFANLDNSNVEIMCNIIRRFSFNKLFIIASHQSTTLEVLSDAIITIDNNHNVSYTSKQAPIAKFASRETEKRQNKNSGKFLILLKHTLSFFRRNITKNIFNIIISFLSFIGVCISFSLVFLDKSFISYDTYKLNDYNEVIFRRRNNDDLNGTSVFDKDIDSMSPDYVSIAFFSFLLKNGTDYMHFNEVRIADNGLIEDDKVIIECKNEQLSELSDLSYEDFHLEVVKTSFSERNVLYLNKNTYEKLKANIYCNSEIGIRLNEESFSSYPVFNDKYENMSMYNQTIVKGIKPNLGNEIIIPERLVSTLGFTNDEVLGKNIEIAMKNISQYSHIENREGTYSFLVTGVSKECIYFENSRINYFLGIYGYNSLDNSDRSIVFDSFDKNTFVKAEKQNLIHVGELSEKIDSAIKTCNSLKPFVIVLSSVFLLVASISTFNNIHTSISKAKKEIGIMICFEEKTKNIVLPFAFESVFDSISSLTLAMPLTFLSLFFINKAFSNNLRISINIANIWPFSFVFLFVYILIVSFAMIVFSFNAIKKKKRIDIIKDSK